MQQPFSCTPRTYGYIERSLSAPRLGRYLGEAKGDKHYALRLYVWNGNLCESFYLPIQITEVSVRNALHGVLNAHHGPDWHKRGGFLCTLPQRLKDELNDVIRDETALYGAAMTTDHIVSGLSFGFWLHLLTKSYEGVFWPKFMKQAFPHLPKGTTRVDLYTRLDRVRVFRNRIAHHKPIFDRTPKNEHANLLELTSWMCPETRWFLGMITRVERAIGEKPRV